MIAIFWDSKEILLLNFHEHGKTFDEYYYASLFGGTPKGGHSKKGRKIKKGVRLL